MSGIRRVVVVDGARTPFVRAFTHFFDTSAVEMMRHAYAATIKRAALPKDNVEYVTAGINMVMNSNNVARDAALSAGFNKFTTPGHTITMACISANQAITSIASMIEQGDIDCGMGGGVDCCSDPPIRFPRKTRKLMLEYNKAKKTGQKLRLIAKLRPSHIFGAELPGTVEFSTGESMGQSCDKLVAAFNVTRREQDEFALRSHELAAKAQEKGLLSDVEPMLAPTKKGTVNVDKDNGIRPSTMEKAAKLKPSFNKNGSVTPLNASFLTDGASATLLMSEEKALNLGYIPKIVIRDYTYVAIDPKEHILVGPAHAISKLLTKNGMTLNDIDVFELHEAFAGQVLANLKAMESEQYTKEKIGVPRKMGKVPIEKVNNWGGSVALGHPFGATGSRLVNMAANRLLKEGGQTALISACAGGALGHAMILERIN